MFRPPQALVIHQARIVIVMSRLGLQHIDHSLGKKMYCHHAPWITNSHLVSQMSHVCYTDITNNGEQFYDGLTVILELGVIHFK